MDDTSASELAEDLKRVAASKQTFHWWMCPAGADGEPVLILARKEGPIAKRARDARQTAKVKLAGSGVVAVDKDGELAFRNDGKLPNDRIEKLFKSKLGADPRLKAGGPALRRARVLGPEEFSEVELAKPVGGDVDGGGRWDTERAALVALRDAAVDALGHGHAVSAWFEERLAAADGKRAESERAVGEAAGKLLTEATRSLTTAAQEGANKLLEALAAEWLSTSKVVGPLYKEAMAALTTEHGEGSPQLEQASEPLVAERAEVNRLKNANLLAESLDRFEVLEELCQAVLDRARGVEDDVDDDVGDVDDGPDASAELARRMLDLEARFLAVGSPEDLREWLSKAAEAQSLGQFEVGLRVLDDEVVWRLERAERNAALAQEIQNATGGGLVDLAKASLAWRGALGSARANLGRWRSAVLADPDIYEDPRYDEIVDSLSGVEALIPDFGTRLQDALDAMVSSQGEERVQARQRVVDAIEDHRKQVSSLDGLRAVEETDFADLPVGSELLDTLSSLQNLVAAS